MSETTESATEAISTPILDERKSYELAFHILPTVAEGEVASVLTAIKQLITSEGGEVIAEEAPQRFELAYEVVKHLEGKNRPFKSAYFGWVRFKAESQVAFKLGEEMNGRTDVLRHLLIRLTKAEEETPFYFHESLESEKTAAEDEAGEIEAAAEALPASEERIETKEGGDTDTEKA